jgi:hypothetical protein
MHFIYKAFSFERKMLVQNRGAHTHRETFADKGVKVTNKTHTHTQASEETFADKHTHRGKHLQTNTHTEGNICKQRS